MQGKVIIWANYRQNILEIVETLQGLFGVDAVASYFGDTTPDERERVIKQFQNPDSPLRFFVGNTQTGGYGITLTEAQNVIYYSNNPNTPNTCLLYTSPSPRDGLLSRMPSSA